MSLSRPAPKSVRTIRPKAIWLYLLIPIAVAWYAVWEYRAQFGTEPSSKQEVWGQFGDFLGGVVNPVVGLITIVLLIMTLRSQQKELQEQRDQIAKQAFEQTLNTWLNSYRSSVHQVYFERVGTDGKTQFSGIRALHEMLEVSDRERADHLKTRDNLRMSIQAPVLRAFEELTSESKNVRIPLPPSFKENFAQLLKNRPLTKRGWKWWRQTYDSNEMYIGMLLRTLYTLIRWIDDHDAITWQQKWDYVSIVRARLSTPELIILFFNHEIRGKNFTDYVERYALLDNLPEYSHVFVDIARQTGTHRFTNASFQSSIAREKLLGPGPILSIAEQRRREQAGRSKPTALTGTSTISAALVRDSR